MVAHNRLSVGCACRADRTVGYLTGEPHASSCETARNLELRHTVCWLQLLTAAANTVACADPDCSDGPSCICWGAGSERLPAGDSRCALGVLSDWPAIC